MTDPLREAMKLRTRLLRLDKQEAKMIASVRERYTARRQAIMLATTDEVRRILGENQPVTSVNSDP